MAAAMPSECRYSYDEELVKYWAAPRRKESPRSGDKGGRGAALVPDSLYFSFVFSLFHLVFDFVRFQRIEALDRVAFGCCSALGRDRLDHFPTQNLWSDRLVRMVNSGIRSDGHTFRTRPRALLPRLQRRLCR